MPKATSDSVTPILVVVHPGSACGSADMNLGRDTAEYLRAEMTELIQSWEGGIVVIDNDFSDELEETWHRSHHELGQAIQKAIEQAQSSNRVAVRVVGEDGSDYNQQDAIADLVREHQWDPAQTSWVLTGAWIEDNGSGCVHSVRETLEELGFQPRIDSAMDLDFELDLDGQDDDTAPDEDMETAPAPIQAPAVPRTSTRSPRRR